METGSAMCHALFNGLRAFDCACLCVLRVH